jgi:hypothetical protein
LAFESPSGAPFSMACWHTDARCPSANMTKRHNRRHQRSSCVELRLGAPTPCTSHPKSSKMGATRIPHQPLFQSRNHGMRLAYHEQGRATRICEKQFRPLNRHHAGRFRWVVHVSLPFRAINFQALGSTGFLRNFVATDGNWFYQRLNGRLMVRNAAQMRQMLGDKWTTNYRVELPIALLFASARKQR